MRTAVNKLKEKFGASYWFSGQMLWSNKLYQDSQSIETTLKDVEYVIALNKTREISLRPETFQDNVTAASARQYLNVLIKRYFVEKNFTEWGMNSKFYDANNGYKIDEFYIEIYTGYKTSCEVYQGFTPKVLIDFSSRILCSDNALYYINATKSSQEAREMLQGRSVVASYGNYRMYRVDDIDFNSDPMKTFTDDKGKTTSLADYYKARYNISVKDFKQPLLVSYDRRTDKEILLIPELVQMTGLNDEMRADFKLMAEVAKHTRLDPTQRMAQIKRLSGTLSEYFSIPQNGIKLSQETSVEGVALQAPKLTLGNNSFVPDRGNYQLRDPIFRPATFNKWLFVYSSACEQDAKYFLETLKKCSGAYAIRVSDPTIVSVKDKKPEAMQDMIRSKIRSDTQIVVVMYPAVAKKSWYKALKDVCYKEKGVPCQAIVSSSLKKNAMSVCSKILLQMNAKIGLELWVTEKPKDLPEKTMIIGADVYHNTKIGQESKSCIGFCASIDPAFSKFFSKVKFQNKVGEEIMGGIGQLVKEAVLKYFAFNGKKFFPECIIFFRDGVAENQLRSVLDFEVKAILDQLKTIKDYAPKFAEVVVTKRIDDRIFTTASSSHQRGGRGGSEPKEFSNPPAGTIVANSIVSNNFDYIMVAQNVTQGTCTPTRYNVVYDTTGLSQDVFWQLSYSQCYNYFNWNGSVRVPAPVQYAHKLAYLVGQTIRGEMQNSLDDTLYYL